MVQGYDVNRAGFELPNADNSPRCQLCRLCIRRHVDKNKIRTIFLQVDRNDGHFDADLQYFSKSSAQLRWTVIYCFNSSAPISNFTVSQRTVCGVGGRLGAEPWVKPGPFASDNLAISMFSCFRFSSSTIRPRPDAVRFTRSMSYAVFRGRILF